MKTLFLTTAVVIATTAAMAQDAQTPQIPTHQAVQCQNFIAHNAAGVVEHYEDCTPQSGATTQWCEIFTATNAAGKTRKIQNCGPKTPRQ